MSASNEATTRHPLGRAAYERLRDALILGELRPGERLTFCDVAARFGARVIPVRKALLQLVAEGVMHAQPGRTVMVQRLTVRKFIELRDIRLLLEPHAAEVAVRQRAAGLGRATQALHAELLRSRERAGGGRHGLGGHLGEPGGRVGPHGASRCGPSSAGLRQPRLASAVSNSACSRASARAAPAGP